MIFTQKYKLCDFHIFPAGNHDVAKSIRAESLTDQGSKEDQIVSISILLSIRKSITPAWDMVSSRSEWKIPL